MGTPVPSTDRLVLDWIGLDWICNTIIQSNTIRLIQYISIYRSSYPVSPARLRYYCTIRHIPIPSYLAKGRNTPTPTPLQLPRPQFQSHSPSAEPIHPRGLSHHLSSGRRAVVDADLETIKEVLVEDTTELRVGLALSFNDDKKPPSSHPPTIIGGRML